MGAALADVEMSMSSVGFFFYLEEIVKITTC